MGRLAAEYTLVENVFIAPVGDDLIASRAGRRMARMDGKPDGWSPIGTTSWSPSGAVNATQGEAS